MGYIDKNFKYTNPMAYDQRHESNPLEYYVYSVWHDFLVNEIKKYSHEKIIADLGCGTCEYTQYMNGAKKIHAIDISPEMLSFCKKKLTEKTRISTELYRKLLNSSNDIRENLSIIREVPFNVEFKKESALNTSLINNSCDVVASFGLLEYINPKLLTKEINRIIKNNGNLLLLFPNKYNPCHIFTRLYGKLLNKKRKRELSLFEIKKILRNYNFKIEKIRSRGMIFYTRGRLQKYCVPVWKFLDFIYAPFQNIFPLGCNIYIKAIKK